MQHNQFKMLLAYGKEENNEFNKYLRFVELCQAIFDSILVLNLTSCKFNMHKDALDGFEPVVAYMIHSL